MFGHFDTEEHKSHLAKIGFFTALISFALLYSMYVDIIDMDPGDNFLGLNEGKWVVIWGIIFIAGSLLMVFGIRKWMIYRGWIT